MLSLLLQISPLLDILVFCVPAHRPACPILPGVVMNGLAQAVSLTEANSTPLRAACAVAGWCAEGWLLADPRWLQSAALGLTTALQNYCTPWSHMHAHAEKFDPLVVVSDCSEGGWTLAGPLHVCPAELLYALVSHLCAHVWKVDPLAISDCSEGGGDCAPC
jgi:hypothetical protein